MRELNFKCCVIGGGISGLYLAYKLIQNQIFDGHEICVVEASSHFGGRLDTQQLSESTISELGAGRFNPRIHLILEQILREFSIDLIPFEYKIKLPSDLDYKFFENCFHTLSTFVFDESDSFVQAIQKRLGVEAAHRFCSLSGYKDALMDKRMSAKSGFDLISKHPEIMYSKFSKKSLWMSPRQGYKLLIDCLFDSLSQKGIRFMPKSEIIEIKKSLGVISNSSFLIHPQFIFFAIPPTLIKKIKNPWADQLYILDSIVNISLFKCFVQFEETWWKGTDLDMSCFVSENETQKLYFNSSTSQIFFYCDHKNALFWKDLSERSNVKFIETLLVKIEEVIKFKIPKNAKVKSILYKFWPIGVSYLEKHSRLIDKGFYELSDNVCICSDVFTKMSGWIEGSLMSVEAIISKLEASKLKSFCTN